MASVNFNMTKNSCFGDITNCNSLNIGVVSFPTVNNICRNSFYKLTNVLLLLFFLLFWSSVVSFGMDQLENQPKKDCKIYIAPRDRYLRVPSIINKISMLFLTKVMGVNENGMKDKVDNEKLKLVFLLSLYGLNEFPFFYGKNESASLLIYYHISTIVFQPFYRGIFSVKPLKKIKEGGNWELYLGVGDVPYIGGLFNLSLVCEPTLHIFLQDKVTIHIFDLKPFNFILGCVFSTWLMWYTKCKKLYIRPQWIVGFGTVEINVAKYYNISFNVGSCIVDLITFMKYTKEANKNELEKDDES